MSLQRAKIHKITYMLEVCKEFFGGCMRRLQPAHLAHFWRLVLPAALLASRSGRRNLSRFTAARQQPRTRQALAHFLEEVTL